MKKTASILLLVAVTVIVGCAHAGGGGSGKQIAVDIPDGWKQLNVARFLVLTREDPYRQYILAQERSLEKPFRNTRKTFEPNLLPLEAAEIVVDELAADEKLIDMKVHAMAPAYLNGGEGFKIIFSYKDEKGRAYKTLYYGFFREGFYYSLRYNALARLYRSEDVRDFHSVIDSFRLEITEKSLIKS